MTIFRKLLRSLVLSALATILIFVAIAVWPSSRPGLDYSAPPFTSYEAAKARAASLLAIPIPVVRPECRTIILDHGHRTRDVYVLLHGLTNCPAQFRLFADQIYAHGANVLIPRLPYHGFTNRLTDEAAKLTAHGMIDTAGEAIDLARGYGERVVVVGLSVNGVTAAWIAQQRPDVDLVVAISPFFAPAGLPDMLISPLAKLLLRLPNSFAWWDANKKAELPGSPFSYPRFSTRSIGETMFLGLDVFHRASAAPPRAKNILLVTSSADTAISLGRVAELAALWKSHATQRTFPDEWKVPHDCIDPMQPGGNIKLVYPRLIGWIDSALR